MWARRLGRATPALACGCLGWSSYNQVHCETAPSFTVGSYNVLCTTYALKWKELQGMDANGNSNWSLRWPVMREVEKTDVERIVADLGPEYTSHYFKHPEEGRPPDGLLIAVKTSCTCASPSWSQCDFKGKVIFGGVNFQLAKSGARVRVVNGHMRGGNQKQLDAFAAFGAEGDAQIEVITADFNEDFEERSEGAVFCPFKGQYVTLRRSPDLPQVSRPGNKQAQTPGQGLKIDYIWVRERSQDYEAQLSFDDASRRAILESHKNCEATGQWPSDHGCEALNIRVLPRRSWWQFWK
ncbi:unnamed protein product [Durusdinium trenchii]|uniref:Uncharacterized protein n=1 Tax=Durusdinium trenchii TaxID=1381693 RepID=A0ABP0SXK3_9DINO